VAGALLADEVNDLAGQLDGARPTMADPEQAGFLLGALLDRRVETMLVVDGLWDTEQLRPFLLGW
jgi:hypothetical protein